ncbi:MAG: hypothetical protein ACD_47C00343G0001, partial [uncultured bacterium]
MFITLKNAAIEALMNEPSILSFSASLSASAAFFDPKYETRQSSISAPNDSTFTRVKIPAKNSPLSTVSTSQSSAASSHRCFGNSKYPA